MNKLGTLFDARNIILVPRSYIDFAGIVTERAKFVLGHFSIHSYYRITIALHRFPTHSQT